MGKYCTNCGTLLEDNQCKKCGINYNNYGYINRKKIKSQAREMLSKDLWKLLKPVLLVLAIELVMELLEYFLVPTRSYFANLVGLFGILIVAPLTVGLVEYYLNYVRGKEFHLTDIFNIYDGRLLVVWGVSLLTSIYTMLWSMLFVIPGIIAAISYSMVHYIIVDTEIKSSNAIISRSKFMMQGYKSDYFSFLLSFIGWVFLSIFSYGLVLIYVIPYMQLCNTLYYEELKKIKES